MQKFIAFFMLLGWVAFAVLQQVQVMHAVEATTAHSCTLPVAAQEEAPATDDCCAKLHGQKGEKDSCTPQEKSTDKDCCSDQGCARTCCSTTAAIVLQHTSSEAPASFFIPTHTSLYPHHHLPIPFIGIDTPPPNV